MLRNWKPHVKKGFLGALCYNFFLTLVCQVLLFLDDARGRASPPPCWRACSWLLASNPGLIRIWLMLVALSLESWPDSRLALAGGS